MCKCIHLEIVLTIFALRFTTDVFIVHKIWFTLQSRCVVIIIFYVNSTTRGRVTNALGVDLGVRPKPQTAGENVAIILLY